MKEKMYNARHIIMSILALVTRGVQLSKGSIMIIAILLLMKYHD